MDEKQQFEKAITHIRHGENDEGRKILVGILKLNPRNELAWLWLARALPDDEQRIQALEQSLKVNPNSESTRRMLDQLRMKNIPGPLMPVVSREIEPEPLPGRKAEEELEWVAPHTPLADRINRQTGKPKSLAERLANVNDKSAPVVATSYSALRKEPEPAVKKPKRRKLRRRFGVELVLGLLLLVAVALLAWVGYNSYQQSLANQELLGISTTVEALEQENATLRQQITLRETETALQSLAVVPPPATATPQPEPTPTEEELPEDGLVRLAINPQNAVNLAVTYELPGDFFFDLDFSPSGVWLAAASRPGVTVWDTVNRELVQQINLEYRAESVVFSPQGDMLAFTQASLDGNESFLFSASTVSWEEELAGIPFENLTENLIFYAEGERLVLLSLANQENIRLVNAETGAVLATMDHPGGALVMDMDETTGILASGGNDHAVYVWDLTGRLLLKKLTGHASDVTGLAFSPDGSWLASASQDGAIMLWDCFTWQIRTVLEGHPGGVRALAFSPFGSLLVTAGGDNQVRLWEVETGNLAAMLEGTTGLEALAFSPDGGLLAAAGADKVILWALP
jgi:cell division protein FtsB